MEVDSRGRQNLGYCLAAIADHVPVADRRVIQAHFLASDYISDRRRGYKSASHDENLPQNLLLDAWKRFGDPECGWLIIKMFPVEFLVEHRQTLRSTFSAGWQLARLYLRIGQVKPHLLKELKAFDQISYCYVLAKLGRELTLKEAIEIIDGNVQDEQFGLPIWALGRLRQWQALEYVESQFPAIEEIKLANMRTKYGI